MRAVLLAGGRGTRLRPFTTTIPKPLVPVGDIPIMELLLRQLASYGCDRVTVAVGHMAQLIMAYFGDGAKWGLSIDYSIEDEPLNTIGPLKLIPDLPEYFLVMNGDLLTDLDMAKLFASHVESGAVGTVATYERDVKIDFGVLQYDADRRVTGFVEKPVEHFSVSMGIYAFSRQILEMVPEGKPFGFDELMIGSVERGLDVRAYPHDGYWLDIGRPDDYDQANRDVDGLIEQVLS
ncbi:MAG: NTP transferase domain-containing protein [Candidatus Eisenbacteria bacterium]|nr:NTP transferase domain-containing protein [Candidatus Eisenbacteria bacterium]